MPLKNRRSKSRVHRGYHLLRIALGDLAFRTALASPAVGSPARGGPCPPRWHAWSLALHRDREADST